MKADELMLGDWVLTPLGKRRVDSNNIDGSVVCRGGIAVGLFCDFELDPIPLTAEILEKNSFKKVVGFNAPQVGYYLEVAKNVRWDLMQADGGAWFVNDSFILVLYVHELQHALKLYGIEKEITL